jgi:hypothetical protein
MENNTIHDENSLEVDSRAVPLFTRWIINAQVHIRAVLLFYALVHIRAVLLFCALVHIRAVLLFLRAGSYTRCSIFTRCSIYVLDH